MAAVTGAVVEAEGDGVGTLGEPVTVAFNEAEGVEVTACAGAVPTGSGLQAARRKHSAEMPVNRIANAARLSISSPSYHSHDNRLIAMRQAC